MEAKKADQKEKEGPAKSVEAKAKAAAEKATKKAATVGVSKDDAKALAKAAAEKVKKKGEDGVLKADDLAKHLIKEVSEGVGSPSIELAKKISHTIAKNNKGAKEEDAKALEKDVAVMVIEAKEASKKG